MLQKKQGLGKTITTGKYERLEKLEINQRVPCGYLLAIWKAITTITITITTTLDGVALAGRSITGALFGDMTLAATSDYYRFRFPW